MKKIFLIIIVISAICSCSMKNKSADFTEKEKNIFVTIEDISEFLDEDIPVLPDEVSFFNFKIPFAGIKFYSYEFEYKQDQSSFYIQNTVLISDNDGMKSRNAGEKFLAAFKKTKIDLKVISELHDINSKIYILSQNGSMLGNFIVYDFKNLSGAVTISGIYFNEENVYLLENVVKQKVYAALLLDNRSATD